MHIRIKNIITICCIVLLSIISFTAMAQHIVVRGKITDAKTGEALPYVNISTTGRSMIGTISNKDGGYILEVTVKTDSIAYQFVGYKRICKHITPGGVNVINIKLEPATRTLKEATVTAKKQKYSRKNNPAV